MTLDVDPRIEERRLAVREQGARRRLALTLLLLIIPTLAGGALWLVQSSTFDVDHIEVSGVVRSSAHEIIADAGVVPGMPIVRVRSGSVESRLLGDPWIEDVRVRVVYPDTVEVWVYEREPVAWVDTGSTWLLAGAGGEILDHAPEPAERGVRIELGVDPRSRRGSLQDPQVLGALTFVDGLPDALADKLVIHLDDGLLWADTALYSVRLGGPSMMGEKAAVLAAITEEGVPPGTVIDLIAPRRPAIVLPREDGESDSQPAVEG